jgi:hypothetical protein
MSPGSQVLLSKLEDAWNEFTKYTSWLGSTAWREYRDQAVQAQAKLRTLVEIAESEGLPVAVYRYEANRMLPW